MTAATTAIAEFLKNADRFAASESAEAHALWGDDAQDVTQLSCLADAAEAQAEVTRQMEYTGVPRARDVAVLTGIHQDLEGETVVLPYDGRLGVAGELEMLVLSCRPDRGAGRTTLEGEVLL